MRIGIYARVSKDDGSQNVDNQIIPLRNFAKALGGEIFCEYVDRASGSGKADRLEFLKMMADMEKHKFDLLLIWALDRLSREGMSNTLAYIERFKINNVAIKSLQETWLDTRDDGLGELMLAIFSWVAQQERKRIVARTKEGLARAKAGGKVLGRPKGSEIKKRNADGYNRAWAVGGARRKAYELKHQEMICAGTFKRHI